MANKLRKTFQKNDDILVGNVSFKDPEAKRAFGQALQRVYSKGEIVRVEGIDRISLNVNSGPGKFPLTSETGVIKDVIVGPSVDIVHYATEIDGREEILELEGIHIDDGLIIRTKRTEIVQLKLEFDTRENKSHILINIEKKNAKSIDNILLSYNKVIYFLDKFFEPGLNGPNQKYAVIKKNLDDTRRIYKMAREIERICEVQFSPENIGLDDKDSLLDLYELYIAIVEKKAIKSNAKLTATESTAIELLNDHEIGQGKNVLLAFYGEIIYTIWGQKLNLHCANFLSNAVVKEITKLENGHTRVTYGDSEQSPMYISYKTFLSEAAAREELAGVIEHKEEYVNAKTTSEYWSEEVARA